MNERRDERRDGHMNQQTHAQIKNNIFVLQKRRFNSTFFLYYSHTLTMTCAVITLHTIAFSTRVIRFVLELFEMCPRVYVDMLFSLKDIRFALQKTSFSIRRVCDVCLNICLVNLQMEMCLFMLNVTLRESCLSSLRSSQQPYHQTL